MKQLLRYKVVNPNHFEIIFSEIVTFMTRLALYSTVYAKCSTVSQTVDKSFAYCLLTPAEVFSPWPLQKDFTGPLRKDFTGQICMAKNARFEVGMHEDFLN